MSLHLLCMALILLVAPGCDANDGGDRVDGNPSSVGTEVADPEGDGEPRTGDEPELQGLQRAYFASGCFWCVEAIFESISSVEEAVSGYAGGTEPYPTYSQVSAGRTSHAETVEVFYDSSVVSYATLVRAYYGSHDPTTVNGQAPDFGTQYRSMILYQTEREREIAERIRDSVAASGAWEDPIATEIEPLDRFYPAELYHQDFERRNPDNSYVKNVSIPRLQRFQEQFSEILD